MKMQNALQGAYSHYCKGLIRYVNLVCKELTGKAY